jgi:hypothetical protein
LAKITLEEFEKIKEAEQKRLAQAIIVKKVLAFFGAGAAYTGMAAVGVMALPWG